MYFTWKSKLKNAVSVVLLPLITFIALVVATSLYLNTVPMQLVTLFSLFTLAMSVYFGTQKKSIKYKIKGLQIIFKDQDAYVDPTTLETELNKWFKYWTYNPQTRVNQPWKVIADYRLVYSSDDRHVEHDHIEKIIYISSQRSRDWEKLQYLTGCALVHAERVEGKVLQDRWRAQKNLLHMEE